MGSGFSKMKKQARLMEEQFEKAQEELKKLEVTGSSGNGLVTLVLDGEHNIKQLSIKPECVDPTDVEGLEDLIKAAFAEASQKIQQHSQGGAMGGAMSGFSLPFGF